MKPLTKKEFNMGRLLFNRPCVFLRGVVDPDGLPQTTAIEVAFAGRSNVGKSSLLNALFNDSTLARTSNTPGRTQEINFFDLDKKLTLVDLPGYGYAKAPEKKVKQWQKFILYYLQYRQQLRRVFILIDSRHGIKETDMEFTKLLDKFAVSYQIVLTKIDKISQSALDQLLNETTATLARKPAAHPDILATSSEKQLGIDVLRFTVATLLEQ